MHKSSDVPVFVFDFGNTVTRRAFFAGALFLGGIFMSLCAAAQYAMHSEGARYSWVVSYVAFLSLGVVAMTLFSAAIKKTTEWLDTGCKIIASLGGLWLGHSVVIQDLLTTRGMVINNVVTLCMLLVMVACFLKIWDKQQS